MFVFKREAVAFAVHAFYSLAHLISKQQQIAAALTVAAPIKEVEAKAIKMDSAQSSSNKCKNY